MSQRFIRLSVIAHFLVLALAPLVANAKPALHEIFPDAQTAMLAKAADHGDASTIGKLLANGASLSVRGDRDVTLLQWMLLNRNLKGMKTLLKAGADPGQPGLDGDTVVHLAAAAADPAYLSVLLEYGAKPDVSNAKSRKTALMSAIIGERDEQFEMLMKAGADSSLSDATGNTAVHVAAQINELMRVLSLLEAGAPPTARNLQGHTFQRYLSIGDPKLLNGPTKKARRRINVWLIRNGVQVEAGVPQKSEGGTQPEWQ